LSKLIHITGGLTDGYYSRQSDYLPLTQGAKKRLFFIVIIKLDKTNEEACRKDPLFVRLMKNGSAPPGNRRCYQPEEEKDSRPIGSSQMK
jgi:hypothetical protein